ncbi:MAG: cupin domain-containing protein [Xanthobacteraceae bacterium]
MKLRYAVSIATMLAGITLVSAGSPAAFGQDALPAGFKTQPLLKTGQTRDNEPIVYPKSGKAEIISVIGTIEPGGRTPLHEHPVPVLVYILEGELELQTEGGQPHKYKAGEAYIESLNRKHQAFNRGSAVTKILVVFVGEEGKPTTIAAK